MHTSGIVNAVYRDTPYHFIPPNSDPSGTAGRRVFGENGGEPQAFVLQSRFFDGNDDITGDTDVVPLRSIFSDADMQRIQYSENNLPTNRDIINTQDFGMVMLDMDNPTATDNFVVLELLNLNALSLDINETWFDFRPADGARVTRNATTRENPADLSTYHFMDNSTNTNATNDYIRDLARQNPGRLVHNNRFSIVGMFQEEGYYRFRFRVTSFNFPVSRSLVFEFAFYIVHSTNYEDFPHIRGDAVTRRGDSNVYYFNFMGENPYLLYNPERFTTTVRATNFAGLDIGEIENRTYVPLNQPNFDDIAQLVDDNGYWYVHMNGNNYPINIDDTVQEHEIKVEIIHGADDYWWIYVNGEYIATGIEVVIGRHMEFYMIGSYRVNSYMVFSFNGVRIPVLNFTDYNYILHIFGFQAHYEAYDEVTDTFTTSWFGCNERGLNADISMRDDLPSGAFANDQAGADAFRISMENWVDNQRSALGGHRAVATNSGPVRLFGNATLEQNQGFLTTVSFNNGTEWRELPFTPNRPFETAGEYIITMYYVFPAATNNIRTVLRQVFHFRIINTMDIRVAHYLDGIPGGNLHDVYHINDFVGQRIPISGSFFVFMDGMEYYHESELSPFIIRPRVQLTVTDFDGNNARTIPNFELHDLLAQFELQERHEEGIYTFSVFFGRRGVAVTHFTIVVDNSPIHDFRIVNHGGTELIPTNAPDNFAIWGSGTDEDFFVELHWGIKPSGIGFTTAEVQVYTFDRDENFSQSDNFNNANMLSPFVMNTTPSILNFRVLEVRNPQGILTGFRIAERFTGSGIYIFRVTDAAMNVSTFVLVIDNTQSAFAQDPLVDEEHIINMVTDRNGANVGFGLNKIIEADLGTIILEEGENGASDITLLNKLTGTNLINSDGLVIPIQKIEMATDMGNGRFNRIFERLPNNTIYGSNTIHLVDENFYTFRIHDHFGNVTEYYVFLNFDRSRGAILEDSVANIGLDIGPGSMQISSTASIVRPGGISNRNFVAFSFLQKQYTAGDFIDEFVVDKVEFTFFPKTWQRFYYQPSTTQGESGTWLPNPNYPFASEPTVINEVIYQRTGDVLEGLQVVPVSVGESTNTRAVSGMYMITRHFDETTVPTEYADEIIKNHFFIVDNNSIIAPTDVFDTDIRIDFGNKTATVEDFQRQNNRNMQVGRDLVIQTNMNATVRMPLFGTKYGHAAIDPNGHSHDLGSHVMNIPHKVFCDTANDFIITPNFAFNSLRLNLEVQQSTDGGTSFETLFDRTEANTHVPITHAGIYRLVFTDGSGGMRVQQFGMGERVVEPNRSEILFERTGDGSNGSFFRNGRRISLRSTQLDAGDIVTFSYMVSDPHTFFADIHSSHVTATIGGVITSANLNVEDTRQGTTLTRTYMMPNNLLLVEGNRFNITLNTVGNIIPALQFELTVDNTPPNHNIQSLRELDHLWRNVAFSGGLDEDTFVFSVSYDFIFSRPIANPHLDTFAISLFEVYQSLSPKGGEYDFTYNYFLPYISGSQVYLGPRPFREIVNLQPNDNRFFRIVERDEAGNTRQYFVNIRGQAHVDEIEASMARSFNTVNANIIQDTGAAIFGTNISITDTEEFWLANPFFEISTGTHTFRRFNNTVSFGPRATLQTENNATPLMLQEELNRWLRATPQGQIQLVVNNGFSTWVTNIFQIDNAAVLPQITATATETGALIIRVVNWQALPQIFRDNANMLRLVVTDVDMSHEVLWNANFHGMNDAAGWQITVTASGEPIAAREALIVVTDLFGREVRIEHNGRHGNHRDFIMHGETREINNARFTGDERGVNIEFTRPVHNVQIYRDGVEVASVINGVTRIDAAINNISTRNDGIIGHFNITPPTDTEESRWRVVIVQIQSGRTALDQEFVFYTRIANVRFTNLSGEAIDEIVPFGDAEDVSLNGMVQIQISHGESRFTSSITVFRTFWDPTEEEFRTERQTVRSGVSRFNLTQIGTYEIVVMNTVWARQVFRFIIADVDNTTYRVFFNYEHDTRPEEQGEQLRRSPVMFNFERNGHPTRRIPQYFVRGTNAQVNAVSTTSNNLPLEIELSLNYPREIVGNAPIHFEDNIAFGGNNVRTFIYELRSTLTATSMYIAITAIPQNLDRISNVSIIAPPTGGGNIRQENTILHALYTTIGVNGLNVSVDTSIVGAHNSHSGNVIFVDYYYNGTFAGTFLATETLTIHARNYGKFELFIRDVAGYRRSFSQTDIQGNTRNTDHFTLYNLARPPLLVNGEIVMDGMVYNNELNLEFMYFEHGTQNGVGMFVESIQVWRNGVELTETFTQRQSGEPPFFTSQQTAGGPHFWHSRNEWMFTEPGAYTFDIRFRYVAGVVLSQRFSVQLVDASIVPVTWLESFAFIPSNNTEIETILRNGVDITRTFTNAQLASLRLDSRTSVGHYEITVRIHDNIRPSFTKEFEVFINMRHNGTGLINNTIGWGTTTTGSATIYFIPGQIRLFFPNATFMIFRDGSPVTLAYRNNLPLTSINIAEETRDYIFLPFNADGRYRVELRTHTGEVIFSDGFEITTGLSALAVIIIVALVGIVLVGAVLFFVMRNRMKVK